MHLFSRIALIYTICASSAYAVPESGLEGPSSDPGCEALLERSPFARIVLKAVDDRKLPVDKALEVLSSPTPRNPFQHLPQTPDNLSLRQGIDRVVRSLSPSAWEEATKAIADQLHLRQRANQQQARAQEETRGIIGLRELGLIHVDKDIPDVQWTLQNGETVLHLNYENAYEVHPFPKNKLRIATHLIGRSPPFADDDGTPLFNYIGNYGRVLTRGSDAKIIRNYKANQLLGRVANKGLFKFSIEKSWLNGKFYLVARKQDRWWRRAVRLELPSDAEKFALVECYTGPHKTYLGVTGTRDANQFSHLSNFYFFDGETFQMGARKHSYIDQTEVQFQEANLHLIVKHDEGSSKNLVSTYGPNGHLKTERAAGQIGHSFRDENGGLAIRLNFLWDGDGLSGESIIYQRIKPDGTVSAPTVIKAGAPGTYAGRVLGIVRVRGIPTLVLQHDGYIRFVREDSAQELGRVTIDHSSNAYLNVESSGRILVATVPQMKWGGAVRVFELGEFAVGP